MIRPRLALLALALPLAGCVSLGPKTPPTLLVLSPAAPIQAGASLSADDKRAVAVAVPTVPQALATQRVLVQDGPTEIAYLKDALWSGPPAALFRGLLAETITARTGRVVPDPKLLAIQPDTRLSGHLVRFGLDGPGLAVEVVFDATLVRSGSPTLQTRRFAARVPVAQAAEGPVGQGINQAANDVATQVADWIGQ